MTGLQCKGPEADLAIDVTPVPLATGGHGWNVGLTGRFQFFRRDPRSVCDVVDQLAAAHPTLPVYLVLR